MEAPAPPHGHRIASLDGLRTVAILAIVAFHYCYRWAPPLSSATLYPYGRALAGLPGVRFGAFGVQLFFIISGFVIAMTLERCRTPLEFAVRRYARLGPAMLIFSLLTFAAMQLIPGAPFPEHVSWFASSLTFIDPVLLNRLIPGGAFQSIAGAYWSLYVEVQFYVLACLLYFTAGRWFRAAMGAVSAVAAALLIVRLPLASPVSNNLLIPRFLPWFILGIGFHALALGQQRLTGAALLGLGVLELLVQHAAGVRAAAPPGIVLLWAALFAAALWLRPLAACLACKPLVEIGAASYGLYLIHENVGVAVLHALPPMGAAAGICAAAAVAAGCVALALVSFRWIERPLSRLIRAWLLAPRSRAAAGAADRPQRPPGYAAD